MSLKWTRAVWQSRRHQGSARCMLLALADVARDEGECFPSVATLAAMCCVNIRNASYLLRQLERDGDIEIQPNAGPRGTNIYRLAIGRSASLPLQAVAGAPLQAVAPLQAAAPLQSSADTPAIQRHSPLQAVADEPYIDRKDPSARCARSAPRAKAAKSKTGASESRLPDCPCHSLIALYHEHLPELPRVKVLGAPREKALHRFWLWMLTDPKLSDGQPRAHDAQSALDYAAAFFKQVRDDDFLMGRTPPGPGHSGWRAGINYLVSDRGIERVLEKAGDD